MKKLLKILLLILITFHLATSAKAQCDCNPTRDSLALVIFKDSLNITFWDTKKPINTWEGVSISTEGCVEGLVLPNKRLVGVLPKVIFDSLYCLKTLDLNYPKFDPNGQNQLIITISANIANLKLLECLRLNWNTILSLAPEMGQLYKLKILQLYKADIKVFPNELAQLDSLEHLNLGYNKLTNVPDFIFSLSSLKELGLNDNEIINIPEAIGNLAGIEKLDLRSNNFTSLPSSIEKLTSLKLLALAANYNLINIPSEIGKLTSLEYLDLSGTKIEFLPKTIGDLSQLRTLNVSGIFLKGLPSEISKLTNLEYLDIYVNSIVVLPTDIGLLRNLKRLDARDNDIRKLPASMSNLSSLEHLNLNSNELDTFALTTDSLKKLKLLTLTKNNLNYFPKQITNLSNLELLYINYNKIKGAIPATINQLQHLQELWINNNDISHLPVITLNLATLSIDSNRLTFDDIIPNRRLFFTEQFVQKPFIPKDTLLIFTPCDTPIIQLGVDDGIAENTYRWRKSSNPTIFTNNNELNLSKLPDTYYNEFRGDYICQITNDGFPNMLIQSMPIKVKLTNGCVRTPVNVNDTLCFYDTLVINTTTYNRANPSGCEVLRGQSCDTLVNINLTFQRTDTTITDTLAWGERRWIHNRWYDCSNPTDTIWLQSKNMQCDSAIYVRLSCKEAPQDNPRALRLILPTAFTPNADGYNDTFDIPNIINDPNQYGKNHLQVFNRFRQLVYERVNYQNQWDGRDLQGKVLPAGTYFYVFQYEGNDPKTGTVTIIR